MATTCAVPSCKKRVSADSITQCCRRHQHDSEHCQCDRCREYRARLQRQKQRPGVTTIRVPRAGCYHGDVIYDPVSVSQPPWMKEVG